jgi:type I restriction enzyme S subunit
VSWPKVKLNDVAILINGRAYKKHEMLSEGKYPLMRVGNFFSNREWYYSDLELPERQYCDSGDLLYAWSASFGPRIWDGGKVIYHYHIWKLVLNEELIDKKYLYYALQMDVDLIKREQGSGSTMIHVTKTAMEDREIPLPTLEEQKRIARILDKADSVRRKRQQAIDLADDFLRSVFLDIFGDPVKNPKGWEIKNLKDIARIQIGPFGTQLHKKDYIENGIPLINPTHIVKGEIIPKSNLTISDEKHASLSEYHLKMGDIVMGRRGEMGRCAIVNSKEEGWMCGTGSLFIRPKQTGIFSEYLTKLLSSQPIKNHLESESQGATMPNLNKTIVGNIKIPVPTDEVLEQFIEIKKTFLKTQSSVIDSLNKPLFESLSQKAFAGEL